MARTLVAHNRAEDSENKVHDPEFARRVGFRGGLVPGVDVFGYLASAVLAEWGEEWLRRGSLEARFLKPVYDGDEVTVEAAGDDGTLEVRALDGEGAIAAAGTAERRHRDALPDPAAWPRRQAPDRRLPAEPEALGALTHLGALAPTVTAADIAEQGAEIREPSPYFTAAGVVHPAHLLRFADQVLMANVALPPWMHVSSRARLFGLARADEELLVQANRTELFERKGHRFIRLDVLITGPAGPVMRVDPYTAIYDPAWNR